jgi:hypothetical protein
MTVSTRGRTSKILLQVEQVPPFMQTASRLFLLSSRNVMWAGNDLKVLISHLKEPLNPLLLASFCWRKKIDSRAGCCYCMLIFLLAFLVETASSIRRPSFVFFLWYEENLAKGFDFLLQSLQPRLPPRLARLNKCARLHLMKRAPSIRRSLHSRFKPCFLLVEWR